MRLRKLAAATLTVATAGAVLTAAPAAQAAEDVIKPVISSAKVTPSIVVLNKSGASKVTVDVVATDNVGVTDVFAYLYQGEDADSTDDGIFLERFTRLSGTNTWRTSVYVDKSYPTGKYRLAVAASDGAKNFAEKDPIGTAYLKRNTMMPSFNASPEPVRNGSPIKVAGQLTRLDPARGYVGYANKSIKVYFQPVGGSWAYQGTATTDASGKWGHTFPASGDGTWQARFEGTANYHAETSHRDYVDVQ